MSLFDDIFVHPRPAQQGSAGNPILNPHPATVDEEEHDATDIVKLDSSGEPVTLLRRGSVRTAATYHRRGSSAHGGHHHSHRRNHSVNHSVHAADNGGVIPSQETPPYSRRPSETPSRVHHIPRATSPVRSYSADHVEIAVKPIPIPSPTANASASPNPTPIPSPVTSRADLHRNPTIHWKDDVKETDTFELGLDNRIPTSSSADLPGILASTNAGTSDNESTYVNNTRKYLTSIAAIVATSRKVSNNEADNQWSVRTAPPAFGLDRKPSVCSTCDGEGGPMPGGTAYDRWKDARSEHTIISGVANADVLKRRDFLIKLSRAFAVYGSPSHRLEHNLRSVSDALDVESNFVVLPGLILISFGNEDHSSSTHLVKAPQGFNMAKLTAVNFLCRDLTDGSVMIDQALERLSEIRLGQDYSRPVFLSTFPIVSFGIAIIGFKANWLESGMSAILGLVVGLLCLAAERYPSFTYLLDFVAALIVGLLVRGFKSLTGASCMDETVVVLSALAILLPGLSLTISIIEISTRNMVSGTVRMFHALFTAMLLGFGMSVGPLVWDAGISMDRAADCPIGEVSPYWIFLIFPVMSVCICIFFQAHRNQWMIMMVVSALGFVTSYFLNDVEAFKKNGGQIPMVLSALAIGLASNMYARISHDVAVAPILAGILLLVPGSVGVRSTLGFLGANTTGGSNFAFQMLIIGMSITIGLFVATLLVFPIRGPKLKYMTF